MKKPKTAPVRDTRMKSMKIIRVDMTDIATRVELEDDVNGGWTIAACAGVRSEGFNRDVLYYTLVR